MEYVQMTLNDWLDMKEQLKKELLGVQASFVRIGYTLRKIKDEKLYERDGYTSIAEFAQTEYGLNPSTVSRFMNINKRYSVDGYSDKLRPEFANLGSSKLTEMLALQESDMEMINPNTSRESIRELKDFNKSTPAAGVADNVLKLIEKFYEDNPDILNAVFSEEADFQDTLERKIEIVNPSGNRSYKKGLFFLMMYEDGIKIKKFGSDPQTMNWSEFFDITVRIFGEAAAGNQTWEKHFHPEELEKEPLEEAKESECATEDTSCEGTEPVNGTDKSEIETEESKNGTDEVQNGTDEVENGTIKPQNEATGESETEESKIAKIPPEDCEVVEYPKPEKPAEMQCETPIAPAQFFTEKEEKTEPPELEKVVRTSRKEYMETLTAYGMACYMARAINKSDFMGRVNDARYWEEWLLTEVDEYGEEG